MDKIVIDVTEVLSRHPRELAHHIASAFYHELRRNGLSSEDIINVSSELLRCLNETLSEYQEKLGTEG